MNTDLIKMQKKDFEKDFFKLMSNVVLGKTIKNGNNPRDMKFITTEWRRNYLVSEPNCHTKNIFFR